MGRLGHPDSPLYLCRDAVIRESNWLAAVEAINSSHFEDWLDYDRDSLSSVLRAGDWIVEESSDESGKYLKILGNTREESGWEDEIISAIAPFFEPGTVIEYWGERFHVQIFQDGAWHNTDIVLRVI